MGSIALNFYQGLRETTEECIAMESQLITKVETIIFPILFDSAHSLGVQPGNLKWLSYATTSFLMCLLMFVRRTINSQFFLHGNAGNNHE